MTKINLLLTAILTILYVSCLSQNSNITDTIQFKVKGDYSKFEPLVLESVNLLLKSPINENSNNLTNLKAIQFMMKWMEGTPDYQFNIDESMVKATKSNKSLLGVFLASMVKYCIENKTTEIKSIKYNSFLVFLKYCEDSKNNVKLDKELKSLIKAKDNNSLKAYLKI